jgi:hypothetical protein
MDLFVVPTIGFNLLYALVISSSWARRIRKLRQRGRTSDSVLHPLAGQTCPRHLPGPIKPKEAIPIPCLRKSGRTRAPLQDRHSSVRHKQNSSEYRDVA